LVIIFGLIAPVSLCSKNQTNGRQLSISMAEAKKKKKNIAPIQLSGSSQTATQGFL